MGFCICTDHGIMNGVPEPMDVSMVPYLSLVLLKPHFLFGFSICHSRQNNGQVRAKCVVEALCIPQVWDEE